MSVCCCVCFLLWVLDGGGAMTASEITRGIINKIMRAGRDFFRLQESERLNSGPSKTTGLSTSMNFKTGQVSNPPTSRERIARRGWIRLWLVLSLLFLSVHGVWGEHFGGEPGDGGSAGDKGSVSGGPPGGDTDVGSAPPLPAKADGGLDSTAPPRTVWHEHSGGEPRDGGSAGGKGGVSGGPPGGDTDLGAAAPLPAGNDCTVPPPALRH